jgi:hypothetical protein
LLVPDIGLIIKAIFFFIINGLAYLFVSAEFHPYAIFRAAKLVILIESQKKAQTRFFRILFLRF